MAGGTFRLLNCATPGVQAVVARSSRDFAPHTHEEFGIGVITSGAQRWHSGRRQVEAGSGSTIAVNPGEVHDGAPAGLPERQWCMLYLEPKLVIAAAGDIRLGHRDSFEIARPVIEDPGAAPLLLELLSEEARSGSPVRREELLLALIARVGCFRSAARREAPVPVSRARARLDDDPGSAVTLQELADLSGVSRFQLLRSFVRVTGLTPHAYLVEQRTRLAKRLIAAGQPLAQAAHAAGFADQSHMTRMFTRKYGFSPGAFARSIRPPEGPGRPARLSTRR